MIKLGIIGTAGRKQPVTKEQFNAAKSFIWSYIEDLRKDGNSVQLVSGGAAASDHIAVQLFLEHPGKTTLFLALPVEFHSGRFVECEGQYDVGRTANYYHKKFSTELYGKSFVTLGEIATAIDKCTSRVYTGFKNRNTIVAGEADKLIALGHEEGDAPKDGGTADTWAKYHKLGKEDSLYVTL